MNKKPNLENEKIEKPVIVGYLCFGCGHDQKDGGDCEKCGCPALEPIKI